MKKRLISLLLAVLMVATLFSGMTVSASADANVTTVTLSSGDTVIGLCQKLGVDYYTYKNLIMALNGYTSEAQFSKLHVGEKVILPVSAAAAAALSGSGTVTGTTTPITSTVAATGSTTITSGSTTSLPAGDRVAYYLVAYTIRSGETISGIYSNWGLSYKTYSAQILKLNNLSNYNAIPANKTLWLPTTSPAVPGAQYYTVMAHTMLSGESAYNIVCTNYGLNFNASQKMLQALNNRDNLGNFYAGEALYIPVAGIVSATTTVTPGTGAVGTTGSVTTGVNYNLVAQTPTNGSFIFEVDGATATAAAAGKTVKVVASPNSGYGVESVKVVKVGDAATTVPVNSDNTFTMPAYSVTVSVTFRQATAYKVTVDNAVNGSVAALVDNVRVDSAYTGSKVTVKTIPATGFMVDTVRVTYNDYRDTVAVENSVFTMPNFPVTVTATFKEDPNYDPAKGHSIYSDAVNGKVETFVGQTAVSTAQVGERVTVKVTPYTDYTVENIKVYYADFSKTVDIEKGAFTMPDSPVTIVATIKATADAQFDITKVSSSEGSFKVTVDGQEVSAAKVGQKVAITATSTREYYNYQAVVTKTGDSSTTVPVDENGIFVMPDFPVTVRLKFYMYHRIDLDASNGTKGYFNVTAAMNGMSINKCGAGVELKVTVWGYDRYLYTPGNVILTYADGSTHIVNGANFIMPDCDVKVRVNFDPITTIAAHKITEPSAAGNYYTVNSTRINDTGSDVVNVKVGQGSRVYVVPTAAIGYTVKEVSYSYTDVNGTPITKSAALDAATGKYYFDMPNTKEGTKLDLYVSFREIVTYAINLDYARDPYGDNSSQKRGSFIAMTSMGLVTNAAENAKITLRFTPANGYKVDLSKVVIYDEKGTDVTAAVQFNRNDYSFYMPAYPVYVVAAFNALDHKIIVNEIPLMADGTRPEGILSVQINNGDKYTDDQLNMNRELPVVVREGSLVTVINQSRDGYILRSENPIVVQRVHGGAEPTVTMVADDRFTFQMPDDDVTITAYYAYDAYNITPVESSYGTFSVPRQASWGVDGRAEEVNITAIAPKPGYEFDYAQIEYLDASGVVTRKLEGTSFTLSAAPQSEVRVTVVFKAKISTLDIMYYFTDTPNASNRYKVNLYVDNAPVAITRGIDTKPPVSGGHADNYDDHVDISAGGIATGKTVFVSVDQTSGLYDQNFRISGISVEHSMGTGSTSIPIDFINGQYSFVMPGINIGENIAIKVIFEKLSTDKYGLTAINTGAGKADVTFYSDATCTTPIDKGDYSLSTIYFKIVADTASSSKLSADKPTIEYTDADGNSKSGIEVDAYDSTTGIGSFAAPAVKPQTSLVLKYKADPGTYTVNVKGFLNGTEFSDARFASPSITPGTLLWGASNIENFTPVVDPGFVVTGVTMSYTALDGSTVVDQPLSLSADGTSYQFSVASAPNAAGVILKVNYAPAKASVTINQVNIGSGTGTVEVRTASNGSIVPDGGNVTEGDTFTVTMTPDAGCDKATTPFTVKAGDSKETATALTANADGSYTVPAANVYVFYEFTKTSYTFQVARHLEEGEADVATLIDITDGTDIITEAGKGDTIVLKAKPGYKITKAAVNYYDADGNPVPVTGCSISGVNAQYTVGEIPGSVIHFQIRVDKDANQRYTIKPFPMGTGNMMANIVFKSSDRSGNTISALFNENVTAYITLQDSNYEITAVKIKYTDYKGNAVTKDLFSALATPDGAKPNEKTVTFGSDIIASNGGEVIFEYTIEPKPTTP